MSGSDQRLLLDTNAIIALLRGHQGLLDATIQAEWIGASVVSYIEFLAYPNISSDDRTIFEQFMSRVSVIDLTYANTNMINAILAMRHRHRAKLPDAIVAAAAIVQRATLITQDTRLLTLNGMIENLSVVEF